MITTNITAYINSYALDGEIIVPSKVMTSTPQDEELNLTYTPNFQLKLNDSYGYFNAQCLKVDFTVDTYNYSAYMYKVNSAADGTVTVQYAGGLEQGETPEPEPEQSVAPTMYYDENTFTVSATGEGTVIMYLDETEIENPYTFEQTDEDATYIVAATAQQDGKTVSDIVSIDCFVPAATQPEEHTLAFELNNYYCDYDIGTGEPINSDEIVINYDGEPIDLSNWSGDVLPLSGNSHCLAQEMVDEFDEPTGVWAFCANSDTVGEYSDTVEFTYNGLTAYTTVSVTITETENEPETTSITFNPASVTGNLPTSTGSSGEGTLSNDGVEIYCSNWYIGSGQYRTQNGANSIRITGTTNYITQIEFDGVEGYGCSNMSPLSGSLDDTNAPNGVWTGDGEDSSIEFILSNRVRFTEIRVYLGDEIPEPETENEPDFLPLFYNQNGSSQRTVTSAYDVSGEDVTQSLNTNNLTENIPAMSSNTKYSIQILDNNNGEPMTLNENNFSMTDSTGEKTLAFWNSTYNTWVVDFQDENSQGLTAEDFLGDVIITVNDVQQTKSLPIIRPYIGTSFEYIYSSTVGAQMIIDLESGNNKMYLVDVYTPGGTGGTYYKDIIVNDGQGNSMLIYNLDSNVADTTNFSTRPDTDFTGQSLTCKEMLSNGNRIKWIAGTIHTFRNGYQIQSSNLPAFTLDSSSTISVDILYPETTSIYSINISNRYPIKIEAGTISASGANGFVEFTDPESGETLTINIFRVDTSTSTDTYNGMVCTLTGIYDALGNVIDWTSLTSNA